MAINSTWTIFLLFLSLISSISCQLTMRKSIFLDLEEGAIRPGNTVVLEGKFVRNRVVQIRFISTPDSCNGGIPPNSRRPPQCQPLVVRLYPRTHSVKIFYKGGRNTHKDIQLHLMNHTSVTPGRSYRLLIKVGDGNYTLILNGETLATVADRIGHQSIIKLRAYGGLFHEYHLKKNTAVDNEAVTCGTRPGLSRIALRIVGGSRAKVGEFPWQAALRRKRTHPWAPVKHMCGASLIKSCWILTAAHCVTQVVGSLSSYTVRVGDYYNGEGRTYSSYEDQQDLEIEELFPHPNFTAIPNPANDIALIQIKRSTGCAVMSDLVRPVCLPTRDESFPAGSACEISGWGAANSSDIPEEFPKKLQKAVVRVQDHNQCRENYDLDRDGNHRVGNHTVCAADNGVDSCQGDSGGPLVCARQQNEIGSFAVVGVTSWGDGCGDREKPGIYTKVADYLDWINEVIERNSPAVGARA